MEAIDPLHFATIPTGSAASTAAGHRGLHIRVYLGDDVGEVGLDGIGVSRRSVRQSVRQSADDCGHTDLSLLLAAIVDPAGRHPVCCDIGCRGRRGELNMLEGISHDGHLPCRGPGARGVKRVVAAGLICCLGPGRWGIEKDSRRSTDGAQQPVPNRGNVNARRHREGAGGLGCIPGDRAHAQQPGLLIRTDCRSGRTQSSAPNRPSSSHRAAIKGVIRRQRRGGRVSPANNAP